MTLTNIVVVSIITLFIYWAIGCAIFWITNENEEFAIWWCMGLVYWILYILCAPFRILRKYLPMKGIKK